MQIDFPRVAEANELPVGWMAEACMQDLGFETYREVRVGGVGGPRADLVGRLGKIVWVVECKAACTLQLLVQAYEWRGRANMVSIASPKGKVRNNEMIVDMLKGMGIGWMLTTVLGELSGEVHEQVRPRICRRVGVDWNKYLREEQKSFCEAGVQSGAWTPFKNTCGLVERLVLQAPGITLKDLLDGLKGTHHYRSESTAAKAIPYWIRQNKIPNIKIFNEGGKLRLYHSSACLPELT